MKTAFALVLVAGIAAAANADVLVTENFTYPNGNLVGAPGSTWTAHSGAGSMPVQVVDGAAVVAHGSGSREDVAIPFAAVLSGDVFASFEFTVTGGSTGVYFAHFKDSGTSSFRARIFVAAPTQGGDYTIGLGEGSAPAATWATDFAFGSRNTAIVSYNRDSGETKLWINPIDASSTSLTNAAASGLTVSTFALRQSTGNSTQVIDNLIVATTFAEVIPAPGSVALAAVGGLVIAGRRRR